jgi:hypothetical protein
MLKLTQPTFKTQAVSFGNPIGGMVNDKIYSYSAKFISPDDY